MAKKITVTLNEVQEKYFNELAYSLDLGNGSATHSQIINHCLLELSLFEKLTDDQLTNWISENYPNAYKNLIEELKDKI